MHVGFDISQTGSGKAGCGYFADAIFDALLNSDSSKYRFSIFPSFGDFYYDPGMPFFNPYQGSNVKYGPRHLTREIASQFWSMEDLENAIGNPDVIHANNFWCPTQIRSARLVYTLYDLGFAINPDWTTEANRVGCFNGVFYSSIAADWILAISESSKADYLKLFPHFPPERIRVIHPCSRFKDIHSDGLRPADLQTTLTKSGFWLSVGTIEPRKNQYRLAEAYAKYLALGGVRVPLVLAGGEGWLMDGFRAHLAKLGIDDQVIMTGYISDQELVWLYRNCLGNLYPSLFEGFGLPILEGFQFGSPTISSNSTSMPEVAGDGAIILDPLDIDLWAKAMLKLSIDSEYRGSMKAAALRRASCFSWDSSASSLRDLYEEALASPKRLNSKE